MCFYTPMCGVAGAFATPNARQHTQARRTHCCLPLHTCVATPTWYAASTSVDVLPVPGGPKMMYGSGAWAPRSTSRTASRCSALSTRLDHAMRVGAEPGVRGSRSASGPASGRPGCSRGSCGAAGLPGSSISGLRSPADVRFSTAWQQGRVGQGGMYGGRRVMRKALSRGQQKT